MRTKKIKFAAYYTSIRKWEIVPIENLEKVSTKWVLFSRMTEAKAYIYKHLRADRDGAVEAIRALRNDFS